MLISGLLSAGESKYAGRSWIERILPSLVQGVLQGSFRSVIQASCHLPRRFTYIVSSVSFCSLEAFFLVSILNASNKVNLAFTGFHQLSDTDVFQELLFTVFSPYLEILYIAAFF